MSKVNNVFEKNNKLKDANKFLFSLVAIIIGIIIGIFLLTITGNSPIDYFTYLFKSSFGSLSSFGNFLGNLAWIIPIGLSMVISFRVGVFNIGSAGQMLFAGFMAYLTAMALGEGFGLFGIIIIAFVAMFCGAFIAWIIGILKTKFRINEVISSIMINWIVFYFVVWGTTSFGGIIEGTGVASYPNEYSLRMEWLTNLFDGSTKINIGIFIAIPLIFIVWFVYKYTKFGYKQDLVGKNPKIAEYLSFSKNREFLKAMLLSGLFAGIAAWIYYFGLQNSFPRQSGEINPDLYQGITIALIGFNSSIGVAFSSLFVSIFMTSGNLADSTVNGLPATSLILASIIIVLAVVQLFIIFKPQENWFKEDEEEIRRKRVREIKKDKKHGIKVDEIEVLEICTKKEMISILGKEKYKELNVKKDGDK